jgi:hypothetical protein
MRKVNRKNTHAALPIVAQAWGEKFGVKVVVGGHSAMTDGKTIVVPYVDESFGSLEPIWGYLLHEAQHVRDTDFNVERPGEFFGSLVNIFEDVRIERDAIKQWPGAKGMLDACATYMVEQEHYSHVQPAESAARIVGGFCLFYGQLVGVGQEFLRPYLDSATKAVQQVMPDLEKPLMAILDEAIKEMQSTQDAADYSRKVIDLMQDLLDQEQQQQQQQQQGQSQQGDDSGSDDADANDNSNEQGDSSQASGAGDDNAEGDLGEGADSQAGGQSEGDQSSEDCSSSDGTEQGGDADGKPTSSNQEEANDKGDDSKGKQGNDPDGDQGDNASGNSQEQGQQNDSSEGQSGSQAGDTADSSNANAQKQDSTNAESDKQAQALAQALQAGAGDVLEDVRDALKQNLMQQHDHTKVVPAHEGDATTSPMLGAARFTRAMKDSAALRRQFAGLLQSDQHNADRRARTGRLGSNLSRVIQGDTKVFVRRAERVEVGAAVHILVDRSLSMQKMDGSRSWLDIAAEAAATMFAAVETQPNTSCGLTYFDCGVYKAIKQGQRLAANKGALGVSVNGSTNTGPAILSVLGDLLNAKQERKVLFVVTDGEPNNGNELKQALELAQMFDVEVYGVGICLPAVKEHFDSAIVIHDVKDLRAELLKLARRTL